MFTINEFSIYYRVQQHGVFFSSPEPDCSQPLCHAADQNIREQHGCQEVGLQPVWLQPVRALSR